VLTLVDFKIESVGEPRLKNRDSSKMSLSSSRGFVSMM